MRKNKNPLVVVGGSESVVEQQTQTEPTSLGAYMTRHVRNLPYTVTKSLAVNLTKFIERREYYAGQLNGKCLHSREYYAEQLEQKHSRRWSTQLIARPILVYPERLQREWAGDVEYEHTTDVPTWITENVVGELRQSIDDVAEIWVDFQLGDLRNWTGRGFRHNPIYPIITIVTHDRCFAQLCYSGFYITIRTQKPYSDYESLCHTGEYHREGPDIQSIHGIQSAHEALIVHTSGDMHIYQRLGMMDGKVPIPLPRKGYYDAIQWRNADGTRSPLPFKKLNIQKELFITTILLELAFNCNDTPTTEFYGSYGFILELITRLEKQNAMVKTKRRAIVKAYAVERMRSSADGKEGSMVWSETMGRLYGLSHRQPFLNYDECMTSTDYQTSEQLYHLANGMGLNPPRGKRGDQKWRRALCRLLTGASLERRESV